MRSRTRRSRRTEVRAAVGCTTAALLIALLAPVAATAAVTVTCPGPPTLQDAIDGAASGDTIDIKAGTCTENVTIDKNLTLRGAGAAATRLDGGLAGTVVTITGGATVELEGLTIRRGSAKAGDANGGGVLVTGGSSVTLREGVVSDNAASANGGGIYSEGGGKVTVIGSSVTGNIAGTNGGGIFAVDVGTVVMITDSTVDDNTATVGHGAGIYLTDATATLTESTVSGNAAGDDGGGIYAVGVGSATLTNVTISGNSASNNSGSGFGGAVFVRDPALTATHSTIHDNSAFRGGGLAIGGLGITTVTLRATILTGNRGTSGTAPNPDCSRTGGAGTVVTTGFNLLGAAAPADCAFTAAAGDLVGVDPLLGLLRDNGGPFTHALLAGSPAIDAVTSGCPPPDTDERGMSRPQGVACDIGAYEAIVEPDYFIDDDGSVFEGDINWLAEQGITKGCNPPTNDRFCPDDPVTRGQMAAFLVRALGYTDTGTGDLFTDDDASVFEADIDRLGTAGVTRGCNPPTNDRFCPGDPVTRGQMAAFLVRALGYTDTGGGDLFIDDDTSIFENDIDRLGTAGVTRGCNPPTNNRFCPTDVVTRGQMAAFLHRALG